MRKSAVICRFPNRPGRREAARIVGLVSHSATVYLAQPVVLSALWSLAYFVSVAMGRPLIGVFANAWYPFPRWFRASAPYKREFGLDFTIFRFFNTYGPRQSADFVMTKFVEAAVDGRDITVYGDGSQSRTFCYIGDNVDATVNALTHGKSVNEVVNIGNDVEVSVLELARLVVARIQAVGGVARTTTCPVISM